MSASERSSTLRLGCIADDFTGATDLANNLVRAGMRVVQLIGAPDSTVKVEADAVVVALKSRTIDAEEAVAQSLRAADWLLEQGASMLYLKVCSTFDSTPRGNIGPVAAALRRRVGAAQVVVTPAFPETGRTVYLGHLFVGGQLLSGSSMRHHPLTPMSDSNLVTVLQQQLDPKDGHVGLLSLRSIRAGSDAIRAELATLATSGCAYVVADAVDDDDLVQLGKAVAEAKLVVAGSGLAIGIAPALGYQPRSQASEIPAPSRARAIVSGSCSAATNEQVSRFIASGGQAFLVDPLRLASGIDVMGEALAWARDHLGDRPVLVYATAAPQRVSAIQGQLGAAEAGAMVEAALARIATGLVQGGVGQLVVAGGETSGAVVRALDIRQMQIGPQISPGVPWCHAPIATASAGGVHLALKSGNFGDPDFFSTAFDRLAH